MLFGIDDRGRVSEWNIIATDAAICVIYLLYSNFLMHMLRSKNARTHTHTHTPPMRARTPTRTSTRAHTHTQAASITGFSREEVLGRDLVEVCVCVFVCVCVCVCVCDTHTRRSVCENYSRCVRAFVRARHTRSDPGQTLVK